MDAGRAVRSRGGATRDQARRVSANFYQPRYRLVLPPTTPVGGRLRQDVNKSAQTGFVRLSSSLRTASPDKVLSLVRPFAESLGITRVTESTRLDRIGIPVFSAIRPTADPRSLCVTNGKGVTIEEARTAAYMEAIEFAVAERPRVDLRISTVGTDSLCASIDQFCPSLHANVEEKQLVAAVEGEDCRNGTSALLPAELVYFPYPSGLEGARLFGTTTNGLASGTDIVDAQLHALAEVIERDIQSHHLVKDSSQLVPSESLNGIAAQLGTMIREAGLELLLRYSESPYRIPFFSAYIAEVDGKTVERISGGWGCHPIAEVAAVRAICEAAQSRLTTIHGARDDLTEPHTLFRSHDIDPAFYRRRVYTRISNVESAIEFDSIDACSTIQTLDDAWNVLLESLDRVGLTSVYRVVLTYPSDPVTVLRIVVPGAESFDRASQRLGPRLKAHIEHYG